MTGSGVSGRGGRGGRGRRKRVRFGRDVVVVEDDEGVANDGAGPSSPQQEQRAVRAEAGAGGGEGEGGDGDGHDSDEEVDAFQEAAPVLRAAALKALEDGFQVGCWRVQSVRAREGG